MISYWSYLLSQVCPYTSTASAALLVEDINDKVKTMSKAEFSEKDSRGALCVDCTECERGRNGSDTDKCSAGYKHKKGNRGSCFSGTLIEGLTI